MPEESQLTKDNTAANAGAAPTSGGGLLSRPESPVPVQQQQNKEQSRLIRFLFVVVYVCCVSGLGMTLSIYYLFLWESKIPEIPQLKKRG